MSVSVPDIIENWISKISISQKATNLVTTNNLSTFETCNTWWAVQCGYVIIDNIEYEIKSFVLDESITIKGTPPVGSDFTFGLKVPFFIHGTPTKANQERELIRNTKKVTPMVYLFEPIREDFKNELNSVERDVSVRMAMLHNYKEEQCTNDIYALSIEAMRRLSLEFVKTIRKQARDVVSETLTFNLTSYAKYGNFITNKGVAKNLFNERLSGVEININMELKRQNKCCNFA